MMSARKSPLELVLTVREQREQAEERSLATLLGQIRQAQMRIEQLWSTREAMVQRRMDLLGTVLTGAEYLELDAGCRSSREILDRMAGEIDALQQRRQQQTASYRDARCQREVISELLERRQALERIADDRAEQRRSEDLFLTRFAPRQHTAGREAHLAETEEAD